VAAGAALVAATAGLGATRRHSAANGTLTIATAEPPQTFDPVQAADSTVDQMALNVYDALVQFTNSEKPVLKAALAKSWTISPSGLAYTFTLRPGVTFHDGSRVTAADVKFTLDRIKKLQTGWASEMEPYASSQVLAPNRIRVKLSSRYAPFLGALSRAYILNSKLVKKHLSNDMGQGWLVV
jgi:peptide/nickel transport system substrate-binding protein